jgi:uncharacterized protein YuzB (UPF0349 family)
MSNLEKIISQLDNLADCPVGTYHYLQDLEPDTDADDLESDYRAFCDYCEQCGAVSQC